MADPLAERIAHQTLHRLGTPLRVAAKYVKTAGGYVVGPGGLEAPESNITLQKGAMYGLGASSSPNLVILTDVSDTKIKYLNYPYNGSPSTMEAWIAKDLLAKGTRTYLRTYGSHIDKKLKSSMESLLKGGKGISENMNDWKQVTIQAVAADPGKDEWRAAEEYGNVGGLDDPEHGQIYEIEAFNSEVPKIKKDKRLKVLKVVNR